MSGYTLTPYRRSHRRAVADLLFHSPYTHTHLDWYDAETWLNGRPSLTRLMWLDGALLGMIACDMPLNGASWVRVASVMPDAGIEATLPALWEATCEAVREAGGRMVCWLMADGWIRLHLPALGFAYYNEIVTLRRSDKTVPTVKRAADVAVRALEADDIATITAVDHAAFAPPWQNTAEHLRQAWRGAAGASVAVRDGQIVGYQVSTLNRKNAHLVRLAVSPALHGQGIGAMLVADMIAHFARRHIHRVSVNTQIDNARSLRLYRRLGFIRNWYDIPVWYYPLADRKESQP